MNYNASAILRDGRVVKRSDCGSYEEAKRVIAKWCTRKAWTAGGCNPIMHAFVGSTEDEANGIESSLTEIDLEGLKD